MATQQSVDCESLTPTQGATQQSVDYEYLTPTRGATEQSVVVKKRGGEESGRQNFLGDPHQRGAKSEVFPNKGEQNQKWLPLGAQKRGVGAKEGGNATSPLHSRGSPTYGNKIRSGCLTPTFSWGQKKAEVPRHPCVLGVLQTGGQSQRWPTSSRESPKRGSKVARTGLLEKIP